MRENPRKGAYHGLQETPDGREVRREEVLRRRLPDRYVGLGPLYRSELILHVRFSELTVGLL